MKGLTTIEINQATMVEAMQQYFDAQLKEPHVVKTVKKASSSSSSTGGYAASDSFEVEFKDKPEAAS